jgi:hypothetical protein
MKNLTKIHANTEGPLCVLFYIFTDTFLQTLKPFFNMKSFLTCAFFCFAACLFAQIPKGKIMSEVGLSFDYYQRIVDSKPILIGGNSQNKQSTFNIFNNHRYFYKNNVFTSIGFGYQHSQADDEYKTKGYNVNIGIGALKNISKAFLISIEFNLGMSKNLSYRYKNSIEIETGSSISKFAILTPQLLYQVHPKILIFTTFGNIGYDYTSYKFDTGFTFTNRINLNLSPRFWNYGFIFLWGKSKEKTTQNQNS